MPPIIWDGLAAHRRRLVRALVDTAGGALRLERLPACAQEVNPVEYRWAYLQQHALADFCAQDLKHLSGTTRQAQVHAAATVTGRGVLEAGGVGVLSVKHLGKDQLSRGGARVSVCPPGGRFDATQRIPG